MNNLLSETNLFFNRTWFVANYLLIKSHLSELVENTVTEDTGDLPKLTKIDISTCNQKTNTITNLFLWNVSPTICKKIIDKCK